MYFKGKTRFREKVINSLAHEDDNSNETVSTNSTSDDYFESDASDDNSEEYEPDSDDAFFDVSDDSDYSESDSDFDYGMDESDESEEDETHVVIPNMNSPDSDYNEDEEVEEVQWNDRDNIVKPDLSDYDFTMKHAFTNVPYYYLSESQTKFSQEYEIKKNEPVTFYLYIYVVCNNTMKHPYLSCLLEYDNNSNSYCFPEIEHVSVIDEEEEDNNDLHLKNACFEKLFPIFNIQAEDVKEDFMDVVKKSFQGYLYEDDAKHGYIAINAEKFIKFLKGPAMNLSQYFNNELREDNRVPKHTWVIMNEIYKEKVYNMMIHPDVSSFFKENDWVSQIQTEDTKNIEMPKMMYSCQLNSHSSLEGTDIQESRLLPPRSKHPVLGKMYFFSDELFDDKLYKNILKVPRFVVFSGDIKVIDDIDLEKEFQKKNLHITSVQMTQQTRTIVGVPNATYFYEF